MDLPPFLYMWFQGAPYRDENWFGRAHEELARVISNCKPELYGYEFAKDSAPHFMYGTSAAIWMADCTCGIKAASPVMQ